MKIKVKKLSTRAMVPQYATPGAACFDLHACFPEGDRPFGNFVDYGAPVIIPTGLAFEIPEGHVMLIFSRSGHGFKNDVRLANCVGVIDSDYRGEVQVKLTNDNPLQSELGINPFDRIAQAMVIPIDRCEFEAVAELGTTERGEGGFGSTGGGLLNWDK